jgi:hypothetical protein
MDTTIRAAMMATTMVTNITETKTTVTVMETTTKNVTEMNTAITTMTMRRNAVSPHTG